MGWLSRRPLDLYPDRMTTVTLSALLRERDASLAARRTRARWVARALAWVRTVRVAPILAAVMTAIVTAAGFVSRHGLVVGALAAFDVSAAVTFGRGAAWLVAGAGLLFLEVRRR